jgi:hypothetical protein
VGDRPEERQKGDELLRGVAGKALLQRGAQACSINRRHNRG